MCGLRLGHASSLRGVRTTRARIDQSRRGANVPFQAPITIATALERMSRHEYVLPAIQREFVWGPDRICKLFDSLMRGYPIGSFLFWKVDGDQVKSYTFYDFVRTYHAKTSPHCPTLDVEPGKAVTAILDGQQRLTALNIGLRGTHAEQLPRMRANNPLAYPTKKLHIDLLSRGDDDELELAYRFRFLTSDEAAAPVDDTFWFPVGRHTSGRRRRRGFRHRDATRSAGRGGTCAFQTVRRGEEAGVNQLL